MVPARLACSSYSSSPFSRASYFPSASLPLLRLTDPYLWGKCTRLLWRGGESGLEGSPGGCFTSSEWRSHISLTLLHNWYAKSMRPWRCVSRLVQGKVPKSLRKEKQECLHWMEWLSEGRHPTCNATDLLCKFSILYILVLKSLLWWSISPSSPLAAHSSYIRRTGYRRRSPCFLKD